MKKLKVYLDTSIVNFLYVNDSPEYRKATEVFFEDAVAKNKIDIYISNIVIDEMNHRAAELRGIRFFLRKICRWLGNFQYCAGIKPALSNK